MAPSPASRARLRARAGLPALLLAVPVFFGMAAAAGALGCNKSQGEAQASSGASPASGKEKPYQTRGTVKSFGEGRKSLKIAHEDVPGYMKAMTMPFAVSSPSVLDGLKEGDGVDFSFTEESDGRLLIQSIKKR